MKQNGTLLTNHSVAFQKNINLLTRLVFCDILIPTYKVGKLMEGEHGYETAHQYHYCYDYGDVHVDLSYVQDLLRSSFRCTLRYFFKAGNHLWKTILKNSSEKIFVSDECALVIVIYKPDNKYIQ